MIKKVKMVRKPPEGLGPLGAGGKYIQRRNLTKLQPVVGWIEIQWILEDGHKNRGVVDRGNRNVRS